MLEDDHYIVNSRNAHVGTSDFERKLRDKLSALQNPTDNEIYDYIYDSAISKINLIPLEPEDDCLICRYLTPTKFLSFLHSRLVHFPAATQFTDRWECSIPEDYNNVVLSVLNKFNKSGDDWDRYVKTRAANWNVSCWTQLRDYFCDHLMWDAYAGGSEGVGITIRYGSLKEHLAKATKQLDAKSQFHCGLVNYEALSILPFNKHYMFRNEKEVRFAFMGFQNEIISISIDEIFDQFGVRISPAATEEHYKMLKELWLRYGGVERVQWPS
jgi:hypothetical protein